MKKYTIILVITFAIAGSFVIWQNQKPDASNSVTEKGLQIGAEIYIDVRTDQEWETGHIDGAVHLDLTKIQQGHLPNLPKDAPLALYCRSGNRADQALAILKQNGFINARNAGSFAELQALGSKACFGAPASCN
jgi:phage shock protein E